jgi:hypothetical protein
VFVHFANYVDEFFDNVIDAGQAQPVTVEGGKSKVGIDFQLTQIAALSSAQAIAVTETTVEGIDFRLHRLGSVSGLLRREVDGYQIGTYTIPDLHPGTYYIRIHGGTTGYEEKYYRNALLASDAIPVSVSEGEETGNINFSLIIAP